MDTEVLFSDDEDSENHSKLLYDGNATKKKDNKITVPLFGMFAIFKTTNEPDRKEDVFGRSFIPPTNFLEPYDELSCPRKNEIIKKTSLGTGFSYFGMQQSKINSEKPTVQYDQLKAEREKKLRLLEKAEENSTRNQCQNTPKTKKEVECSKRGTKRKSTATTPKNRKRRGRIVLDSSSDSESQSDVEDEED